MSKSQMELNYEALNTEMVRAMGRLSAAVSDRDMNAVDVEDAEVKKLLGQMRAMLRVM